jgi:hypothetical protein
MEMSQTNQQYWAPLVHQWMQNLSQLTRIQDRLRQKRRLLREHEANQAMLRRQLERERMQLEEEERQREREREEIRERAAMVAAVAEGLILFVCVCVCLCVYVCCLSLWGEKMFQNRTYSFKFVFPCFYGLAFVYW